MRLMSYIQQKKCLWIGGVQALTRGGALFLRDFTQEWVYRALEAAMHRQGMVG